MLFLLKEASQLINAESLDVTAQTGSASTPTDNIRNSGTNVNQKSTEQNPTVAIGWNVSVGDGVPDVPTAVRRQFGTISENLPIEGDFCRVVEDADPYGGNAPGNDPTYHITLPTAVGTNCQRQLAAKNAPKDELSGRDVH